jgi:hypothetical protein
LPSELGNNQALAIARQQAEMYPTLTRSFWELQTFGKREP